jgi:hypothetical protein
MSPFSCAREAELLALLDRGQWPQACAAELRAHVEGCRVCSEVVLAKQAFQAERASAMAAPNLPTASALWWRAQLRRRNAAVERVGRPILGAQIFAMVLVLLLAAAGLAWQLRRGVHPAALNPTVWIEGLHFDALWSASLGSFVGSFGFIMPVLAMLVLVSGVVVYFASEKQ